MTDKQLERLGWVIGAFADPIRLRIVLVLHQQGELSVADICTSAQIARNSVSAKLAKLTQLNLIQSRREGARLYYSLVDPLAIREDLVRRLGQSPPPIMASNQSN